MAEEPKEEKKIDEPAAEPAKATAPAKSAKPVSPAEPAKSASPAGSAKPASPAEPAKSEAAAQPKAEPKDDSLTPPPEADSDGGEGDEAPAPAPVAAKSKGKQVPFGVANILATFNNTVVTLADMKGDVVAWSSSGRAGFKGSRKSTAFAAGVVGQDAARQALAKGMREVEVRVQGPGAGRETAIRSLQSSGLNISVIKDVTPVPHNGCRPRKRRRV
jgi:small subunit ribosomal protein S11